MQKEIAGFKVTKNITYHEGTQKCTITRVILVLQESCSSLARMGAIPFQATSRYLFIRSSFLFGIYNPGG